MNWLSAKEYCEKRNWQWTLDLINQAQKEMQGLEEKIKQLELEKKVRSQRNQKH